MKEVIDCCDLVVLVLIETLLGISLLEAVFLQHFNKLWLQRYLVLADNEARVLNHRLVHGSVPLMVHYLIRVKSLLRIILKYFVHQIGTAFGHPGRYLEFAVEDLLVKFVRVRVLERQVPADHRKKDDATAPHVNLCTVVLFSCDHFRSCVAR